VVDFLILRPGFLRLNTAEAESREIKPVDKSLDGGQRQLIGLARAMFGRPKLVVLNRRS
jgi:ABC-type protease/lipase transport system fused ATPase/permease subunit